MSDQATSDTVEIAFHSFCPGNYPAEVWEDVVAAIKKEGKNPGHVRDIGLQKRYVSILVWNLHGFSEACRAEQCDVPKYLKKYFLTSSACIASQGGHVWKYSGATGMAEFPGKSISQLETAAHTLRNEVGKFFGPKLAVVVGRFRAYAGYIGGHSYRDYSLWGPGITQALALSETASPNTTSTLPANVGDIR